MEVPTHVIDSVAMHVHRYDRRASFQIFYCSVSNNTQMLTKSNAKSYDKEDTSFNRRYKWAFKGVSTSTAKIVDITMPSLEDFMADCNGLQLQVSPALAVLPNLTDKSGYFRVLGVS